MRAAPALRLSGVVAVAVAVAGCGGLLVPKQPLVDLYHLTPGAVVAAESGDPAGTLVVEEPRAGGGLESNRIAARPSPNRLQHIDDVRWTERAPVMIQTLLIEAFESSGRLAAVGRGGSPGRFDYALVTEVRDFQAEYLDGAAAPAVRVRLRVQLLARPGQEVLGARSVERHERAGGTGMEAIIVAFDRALQGVTEELVGWTVGLLGG